MIALIGLLLGVFLGLVFDVNIPESFSPYMSVAILACLDSVFGAFRASLNNNFKSDIFISGFFGNALLAAGLAYLGDKLGIPMPESPAAFRHGLQLHAVHSEWIIYPAPFWSVPPG